MVRKIVLIFLGLSVGGFMLLDGTRNLLTGTYFGATLGPWSIMVKAFGLDPQHFGVVFVVLGVAWFVAVAGLLTYQPWARLVATAAGALSLWYVPVGTLLSAVFVVVVWTTRPRDQPTRNH